MFMRASLVSLIVVLALASADEALAQVLDRVRLVAGGTETGEVQSMTDVAVQVRQSTGTKAVPVNEIQSIQFDREPIELTQARSQIRNGAFREALETLAKVQPGGSMRPEVRQDIEFYTALASSRLALASRDDQQLRDAGRAMHAFVTAHRRNYHYYEAVEILGDLFAAVDRFDEAQARYALLASTPWPEFKIRSGVLEGRALAAQGKHPEAIGRFEEALKLESDAAGVAEQRLAARLGKAKSQAEMGQSEAAIGAVEEVIAMAEPEAVELQARAHNVLGLCHEKAGSSKEALYAFLYVDVLCSSVADAHAEALYRLIPLFQSAGRDEDSRRAREELLQRYPNSIWAKELQGA